MEQPDQRLQKETPSQHPPTVRKTKTPEPDPQLFTKSQLMESSRISFSTTEMPTTNKILFLAANPIGMPGLSSGEEYREIKSSISTSLYRDRFNLEYGGAARIDDIPLLLSPTVPDIVHFSCHGDDRNHIILEDDQRQGQAISLKAITEIISSSSLDRKNIQCVFLNACYSNDQAEELSKYVKCTIGISGEIEDKTAIKVAKVFYRLIGDGRPLAHAFCSARAMAGNESDIEKFSIFPRHSDFTNMTFAGDRSTDLNALNIQNVSRGVIEITLPGDLSSLPQFIQEAAKKALVTELANRLGIPPEQISILLTRGGSIIVNLELPKQALEKLRMLYRDNSEQLKDMQIQNIDFEPNEKEIFKSIGESALRSIDELSMLQSTHLYLTDKSNLMLPKQILVKFYNQAQAGNRMNVVKEAKELLSDAPLDEIQKFTENLVRLDIDEIIEQYSQRSHNE